VSAPAETIEGIRLKIVERSEQGETTHEADLREEFGIGHDDLLNVLNDLRERGEIVMELPSEWRAPVDGGVPNAEAEAALTRALDHRDGKDGDDLPPEPDDGDRPFARQRPALAAGEGEIVLTKGVLTVMDDETIGKIVKAGVAEAGEVADEFVLRVAL
jgi:hypothetical protein